MPFHGGNAGSNPAGDAKSFSRVYADSAENWRYNDGTRCLRPYHAYHLALRRPLGWTQRLRVGVERHLRGSMTQQLLLRPSPTLDFSDVRTEYYERQRPVILVCAGTKPDNANGRTR